MKNVKRFDDFTYDNILESVNVNKYQRKIQKFYKSSGVELYNAKVFSTSIVVLVQLVQVLLEYGTFNIEPTINNAVAITIFAIGVLTNESKDKVEKLYKYLQDMGIGDDDINKVINQLRNLQSILKFIMKDTEQKIESFVDMLGRISILVPFLSIINNQIKNKLLNPNLLTGTIKEYQDALGDLKFKVFLNRVIRKLDIITSGTNKFQNKDNAKPLKVNDEFKSPAFKTVDTILEESLKDQMVGKSEEELNNVVPIEFKNLVNDCYKYVKTHKLFDELYEPGFFTDYGTIGYGFEFNEDYVCAYFKEWNDVEVKCLLDGMQYEIDNLDHFKDIANNFGEFDDF